MTGFEQPQTVADTAGIEPVLREYLAGVVRDFEALSGLPVDLDILLGQTLSNLAAYLPPQGVTLLARDGNGVLTGTVFVKFHGADTAEIKRLYVRPSARGTGLGRRLAQAAIAEARARGAARVLLDTAQNMTAALALYRDLGFAEIAPYPESENDSAYHPWMVFMELRL